MSYRILNRSLSIVANYFNVSIFRESWLLKEGILKDEDIDASKSLFSPNIVHTGNARFEILIQPPQFLLTLKDNSGTEEYEIGQKIVDKLPHIAYDTATVSINFVVDDFEGKLSSKIFFSHSNPLFGDFENPSEKPRFGVYLSKDFLDARMKIHILPVPGTIIGEKHENTFLKVECELEKSINLESAVDSVGDLLKKCDSFYEYSAHFTEQID